MFYKVFFYTILILAVIFTAGLCLKTPPMHSVLLVYDSDYKIVETQNVSTEKKTQKNVSTTAPASKKETKATANTVVQTKQSQTTPITTKKTTQTTPKTVSKTSTKQVKIQPETKKVVTTSAPQQQTTKTTTTQAPQTKNLEQEEIEWNKWRSNIQNQIMRDVKLPILPQGTIFKFSFDVDKYGRVTNVQTWSMTPSYTPYAIQYIAPVIRSYQGRSILDFPTGSNRNNTTVTGQWKISTSQKYSNSSNFHDIETVQRGN